MPFVVKEPLVSVVIVNFNYGRFIADAIRSVKDQTYDSIECLIVDNNSSDDSVEVIEREIGSDPRFSLHRLEQNLGHLGGALWVLDRLKGEFVTFLDADDILFPNFLACHVQVHLATGFSTGFTTSNGIETNAEGAQVSGGFGSTNAGWRHGEPSLRPEEAVTRLKSVTQADYAQLSAATRYLHSYMRAWLWSAGSANMLRRALLDRLRPKLPVGSAVFGGVDGYYLPIMHAITGVNIINLPLSAYRIHGANDYTSLPSIVSGHTGTARGVAQGLQIQNLAVINMIQGVQDFPIWKRDFWPAVVNVASMNWFHAPFQHPDVVAVVSDRFPSLARHFGDDVVIRELYRLVGRKNLTKMAFIDQTGRRKWVAGYHLLRTAMRNNLQRVAQVVRRLRAI
jgi:hypothetical protein